MDWNNLRFFIAVARAGGLKRSATALQATPATVSRHISMLEQDLQTKLFTRSNIGYALTQAGANLLARCQDVEREIGSIESEFVENAQSPVGSVKVLTTENYASQIFIPNLEPFQKTYRHLTIEFVLGVKTTSISQEAADIAVRLSRPDSGNYRVKKIGTQAHAVYGPTAGLEAATERGIIGWSNDSRSLPVPAAIEEIVASKPVPLRVNSLQAQIAAAKAGISLCLLPCFLGDREDQLVRVIPPEKMLSQKLWLVVQDSKVRSRNVQCVSNFLVECVQKNHNILRGDLHGVARESYSV